MAEQPLDFRVRTPAIAPDAIANILQRKQQIELQQRQQEEQKKQNRFKTLMQAIQTGQQVANSAVKIAAARKKAEATETLATEIGKQFDPAPARSSLINEGEAFGVRPTDEQSRKKSLAEALIRQNPANAKLFTGEIGLGDSGPAARSTESLGVKKFEAGEFGDPRSPEALTKLQKFLDRFDPDQKVFEDNEGNQFIRNKRDGTLIQLTGPEKASPGGKDKARQFTKRENTAINDVKQAIQSDTILNADRTMMMKSNTTRRLLEQNRPGAIGFIRTQMAKAAGEQRITDADIVRFSGSPAILAKARRAFKSALDGNLPDADKADYLALLDVAEQASSERLNKQINSQLEGLEFDITGANMEAVRKKIAPGVLPFIDQGNEKLTPDQKANAFFESLLQGDK